MVATDSDFVPVVSVEFEVYGKVQGVYFTKYCRDRCLELGLVGWVKNSKRGSIVGKMQGQKGNIEKIILDHCGRQGIHYLQNVSGNFDIVFDERNRKHIFQHSGSLYHNYKCDFSIVLAICDANYGFFFMNIGCYNKGETSIFNKSEIGPVLKKEKIFPPPQKLPDSDSILLTCGIRVMWLSKEGSPGCHIERCDLVNFEYLTRQEFKGFTIRF